METFLRFENKSQVLNHNSPDTLDPPEPKSRWTGPISHEIAQKFS